MRSVSPSNLNLDRASRCGSAASVQTSRRRSGRICTDGCCIQGTHAHTGDQARGDARFQLALPVEIAHKRLSSGPGAAKCSAYLVRLRAERCRARRILCATAEGPVEMRSKMRVIFAIRLRVWAKKQRVLRSAHHLCGRPALNAFFYSVVF